MYTTNSIEQTTTVDIVALINEYVELKPAGINHKGFSPFSEGEKTPSFVVSPAKNIWKCFSSGAGGVGPVSFVQALKNCTWIEAVKEVAENMNITLERVEMSEKVKQQWEKRETLYSFMRKVADTFQMSKPSEWMSAFLKERQIHEDSCTRFELGYAAADFGYIKTQFPNNQLMAKELGLVNGKGNFVLYNRLIFPIHNEQGKIVGFGGRKSPDSDDKYPKYLNSPESEIYNKSTLLYGLYQAKKAIRSNQFVYLVEGYTDVIAMHQAGIENTVATCGTALSSEQVNVLRRYCGHVVVCRDGDAAGVRAIHKDINILVRNDMESSVCVLPDGLDPDEFIRLKGEDIDKQLDNLRITSTEFLISTLDKIPGPQRNKHIAHIAEVISYMKNVFSKEAAVKALAKKSGAGIKVIRDTIAELEDSRSKSTDTEQKPTDNEAELPYILPFEVNENLDVLKPIIDRYQMFIANNKIWMQRGQYFAPVSNFEIEIIQHMLDDTYPMKLIRLKNVYGEEVVFHAISQNFNTIQSFFNICSDQGNYLFTGSKDDLLLLQSYLFDKMSVGKKIEVLGWQPEGFFAFNNMAVLPDGAMYKPDKNGVLQFKKHSFYLPSANRVYWASKEKYLAQRRVKYVSAKLPLSDFMKLVVEVHRGHGMTAMCFVIMSLFSDVFEKFTNSIPFLFLYGKPSTGKDKLLDIMKYFFGTSQEAINIGSGLSTGKAHIRKLAQFRNMIVHYSEYKPGDQRLNEKLKGIFDRNGYERGTLESKVSTDTVPVESAVVMTGNGYPDDDALISRMLVEEMQKTDFTEEEDRRYSRLYDIYRQGISSYTAEIMRWRSYFEKNAKSEFRKEVEYIKQITKNMKVPNNRFIENIAIMTSCFNMASKHTDLGFSHHDLVNHLINMLSIQIRKVSSISVSSKFWDCFLAACRESNGGLHYGQEYKLEGNTLYLSVTHTHNKMSPQWWKQYQEKSPSKMQLCEMLQNESGFIKKNYCCRMSPSFSTSTYVFNVDMIIIGSEIKNLVRWLESKNLIVN